MLARCGEVAVPKEAIINKGEELDVIIFGTVLQIGQLAEKLRGCKPTSLKRVSKLLRKVLKEEELDFRYKYGFG